MYVCWPEVFHWRDDRGSPRQTSIKVLRYEGAPSAEGALKITEIRPSWKVTTACLLSACSAISSYQYAVEMPLHVRQRLTAPVKRLPDVVEALNNEVTRLTGKKPAATVKENEAAAKPSTPYVRPVGVNETNCPPT